MTTSIRSGRRTEGIDNRSPKPERRFEAVVFDWDGTAVPDREADASRVRSLVESLCASGMEIGIVSGTHVDNVDGQLRARPSGPGCLYLCLNRGSEVFSADRSGVHLLERRRATDQEDDALDLAAAITIERLRRRGLEAEIVSQSLNRRKIDVIPEPQWMDPTKAPIGELLEAVEDRVRGTGIDGLPEVVAIARAAARDAGLRDPRVTSDAKHVEIGLTDKSDSARWLFRRLWASGIRPTDTLIVGDEFGPLGGLPGSDSLMLVANAVALSVGREPGGVPDLVIPVGGGPTAFEEVMADQLAHRRHGDIPSVGTDPGWTVTVDRIDPRLERVNEALLTLADGRIGTNGSPIAEHPAAKPNVLAAGIYDAEASGASLLPCPTWAQLSLWIGPTDQCWRSLDLRSGALFEELRTANARVASLRFSSMARPGLAVLRAQGSQGSVEPVAAPSLRSGLSGEQGSVDGVAWARLDAGTGGLVTAVRDATYPADGKDVLERFVSFVPDPLRTPQRTRPVRNVERAAQAGFEAALNEHRKAWAGRWDEADVVINGDLDLQLAIRLAIFHLMASVADEDEAAVGARGLSGPAYHGHVFWDSDVFVLPFLAATHPAAARAMLEYRIRRLPAARAIARAAGRAGAQFPWESAHTGTDVTPEFGKDRTGKIVPIRTGHLENHIVADVAWASAFYEAWTGDEAFIDGPGAELLFETARYWASRVRWDRAGFAHIYGVIGPDEYHEPVDDNAFTNVMARWNLRRAAAVAEDDPRVQSFERLRWQEVADALVDGFDPRTGLYEQFAGFYDLEPLVIADVATKRPIAADLLLGRDRVRAAQVIKQADVLMLHHLVPDEVAPGSLGANLTFYEPRTAHGSSLSPGIHASLFARAGRLTEATRALDIAARMDLDDLTGTTAGGVHLATMGSLWQALVFGFAGIRPERDVLRVDPELPKTWGLLEITLRFRDSRVQIRIEPGAIEVQADPPATVAVGGADPVVVPVGGRRWPRDRHPEEKRQP